MEIQQAKEAKEILRMTIIELLQQFTRETGLIVDRVDLTSPNALKNSGERIVVYRVDIEVKL